MPDSGVTHAELGRKLDTLLKHQSEIKVEMDGMKKSLSKTEGLVEAYATVQSVSKFVKWFSVLCAGLAGIMLAIKAIAFSITK